MNGEARHQLVAGLLRRGARRVISAADIHAVIRGAADRESFAVALRERLLGRRLAQFTALVQEFLLGDLAPGVDADEAGQRYAALVSPELYHLVIEELGWTPERHRRWSGRLLQSELLAPGT
ncbi:MAG: hypothetical protein L0H64_03740 [Pseudonocardia sp.]|nr:hypothetical protein [Pseudonocardia sp.]